eukprot:1158944-Pelagomonas_calceolata.AAC.2
MTEASQAPPTKVTAAKPPCKIRAEGDHRHQLHSPHAQDLQEAYPYKNWRTKTHTAIPRYRPDIFTLRSSSLSRVHELQLNALQSRHADMKRLCSC